ncbi:hypothetical protein [Brochothrix phage ADU4]|nr:hypothetical protein [Brochothrix phage ADU4]
MIGGHYTDGNPKRINIDAVDKMTLKDYGITADQVKAQMFGIPVVDPNTGEELGDDYYNTAIHAVVSNIEKTLSICILPRMELEMKDYYATDNILKLRKRPVLQVEQFNVQTPNMVSVNYPDNWWRVSCLSGSLEIQPSVGALTQTIRYPYGDMDGRQPLSFFGGYSPYETGRQNYSSQRFKVGYVAGLLPPERLGVSREWEMHPDLLFLILKASAIHVLEVWGRLIIGPGIASSTLDIDGIMERIDTTQSAMYGGASADILQLNQDVQKLESGLKAYYAINIGII